MDIKRIGSGDKSDHCYIPLMNIYLISVLTNALYMRTREKIIIINWLQHPFKAHSAKHVLGAMLTARLCRGTMSPSPL